MRVCRSPDGWRNASQTGRLRLVLTHKYFWAATVAMSRQCPANAASRAIAFGRPVRHRLCVPESRLTEQSSAPPPEMSAVFSAAGAFDAPRSTAPAIDAVAKCVRRTLRAFPAPEMSATADAMPQCSTAPGPLPAAPPSAKGRLRQSLLWLVFAGSRAQTFWATRPSGTPWALASRTECTLRPCCAVAPSGPTPCICGLELRSKSVVSVRAKRRSSKSRRRQV